MRLHREQSWTCCVKDHKHGLSLSEAESLLTLLYACAWAPPGDDDVASIYNLAVNNLKDSEVWKSVAKYSTGTLMYMGPRKLLYLSRLLKSHENKEEVCTHSG